MKSPLPEILALLAFSGLLSCEKARTFAAKLSEKSREKPAETTALPQSGALVSEISEAQFEAFSQQPGRLVLIDFYADWCGPCRQLSPLLERIATEHQGALVIGKINVDQAGTLASKQGVRGIPDVRIFRDGKQVDKFVGLPPENQLRELIAKHAKGLKPGAAPAGDGQPPAAKQPSIQPMDKEWLPEGMQRR